MQPFAIVCTTCSTRLKVRDPRLIGQIVACPSCGAMVEIPRPAEASGAKSASGGGDLPQGERPRQGGADAAGAERVAVGRQGPVDSQAITRDAISQNDLVGVSSDIGHDGPVFASSDASEQSDKSASAPAADGDNSAADSAPIPAGWQSEHAERARQVGLITALAVTGIVVAAITFGFFVRRWQHNETQQRQQLAQQDQPVTPEPVATEADAADDSLRPSDEPPQQPAAEPAEADDAAPPHAQAAPDADDGPENGRGDSEEADLVQSDAAMPNAATPDAPASTAQSAGTADAGSLASDGSAAAAVAESVMQSPTNPAALPAPAAPPELPAGLRQFTPLIDFGSALPEGTRAGGMQAPPTLDQVRLEGPTNDAEDAGLGPAEPVDAPRWLKMRLALQGEGRPLTQWVRILSQVTGVPIQLDLATLDAAGIDPAMAIDAPQGWTTAGEAVMHLAAGAGLSVKVEPTHVTLDVSDEAIRLGVQPALRIDDLDQPVEDSSLLEMLQQISGVASVTRLGEDALQVDGDRQAVWRVALAAEAIRLARGLPLRLRPQRSARWLTRPDALEWPLVTRGSGVAAVDQPQSVLQWLGAMAQANDRQVIVAWGDAWQRGLTPQSSAMPWMRPVQAGEVIAEVLDPYHLQAREAGGGLWWIGSQSSYDRGEVVGAVPMPAAQAAQVLETLGRAIPSLPHQHPPVEDEPLADEEAPGEDVPAEDVPAEDVPAEDVPAEDEPDAERGLPAVYDPASEQLIVRLPRYLVRQIPGMVAAASSNAPSP